MKTVVLILMNICQSLSYDEMGIPVFNSEEACGPNQPLVVKVDFGFVMPPEFDNFRFAKPNRSCSWQLIAHTNMAIDIKSISPRTPIGGNCNEDFLKIYDGGLLDGGTILRTACGFNTISPVLSKKNMVTLRYQTGTQPYYTGFRVYFEHSKPRVPCFGQEVACRNGKKCVRPSQLCDGVPDCDDGSDEENCRIHDALPSSCGQPKIHPFLGNGRIVGGREALEGSWPWTVSLRLPREEPFGHYCGGALVSDTWVLTAAHCFRDFRDPKYFIVTAGKYYKMVADQTEQFRYVDKIFVHPGYKGLEPPKPNSTWIQRKEHDIALVKVNAPFQLTDYVQPVCMPNHKGELPENTLCHVTGWGATFGTGGEYVLKQAAVPTITRLKCDQIYRQYTIADSMICAGYTEGGHDSCKGDSGGPLVLETDGRWRQIGVVSFGEVCAAKNSPGIYTDVVYYVQWINDTVTSN